MDTTTTANDKKKTERTKTTTADATGTSAVPPRARESIALDLIDFDPRNRIIDEESESFRELLDCAHSASSTHRRCSGKRAAAFFCATAIVASARVGAPA